MSARQDFAAMDETMTYDAGKHAHAYAQSNLHHLEDECGIVQQDPRALVLARRIGTRQGLLASGPLTDKARRDLEDANEMDAQELALLGQQSEAGADAVARDLGAWLIGGVCGVASLLMLVHFAAKNWGL